MVSPLYLVAVLLGAAFLHPLFEKGGKAAGRVLVTLVLIFTAALPVTWFIALGLSGQESVIFQTAGFKAPLSINFRVGLEETVFLIMMNAAALFGALFLMLRKDNPWEGKAQVLFLTLVLGVNGLILTRDIFNIFVFLEIASISVYALIAFSKNNDCYEAGFKYMVAGGIASVLFLIGVIFLYKLTGTLNLDVMIERSAAVDTKVGITAMAILVSAILIELKPFPANGWGADAYEAADPGISAMMSALSGTAIFFVFYKLTPLMSPMLLKTAGISGGATFFFSQLVALRQEKVRRMLGYSSIGQIGLLVLVVSLTPVLEGNRMVQMITPFGGVLASGVFPLLVLIAGNHLLSKAGLFWMSGSHNLVAFSSEGNSSVRRNAFSKGLLGLLTASMAGFPPFPAFWAKWLLVITLASSGFYGLTAVILIGSLIEAGYLFRWFVRVIRQSNDTGKVFDEVVPDDFSTETVRAEAAAPAAGFPGGELIAPVMHALILAVTGLFLPVYYFGGLFTGAVELVLLLPLLALSLFTLFDLLRIPFRLQTLLAIAGVAAYGIILIPNLTGIKLVFGLIFIAGSGVQIFPLMARKGANRGVLGMLTMLILSLGNLLAFKSNLGFFFSWEIMTISSFFLLLRGERASAASLRYLIMSLGGAFMILSGLAVQIPAAAAVLIGLGVLVKLGTIGLHIWLPSGYAEAEDDISTFFSSVLSKAGLYMLFILASLFSLRIVPEGASGVFAGIFSGVTYSTLLGWLGVITAVAGAFMALFKEDIKYTLAYSSMGQVGYMLLSFALMSQLGWINSLYLAVTHLLFKGMLFSAVAGVIYRTRTRMMYQMGGLISRMPISFFTVLIGIIALSGVPPLTGFGSKWMLYTALIEKGWYLQAAAAMFASGVAFLYLFRLIHTMFLGQLKDIHREVKEAPVWFLIPQVAGIIGIMLFSMYPTTIINPLAAAVAPFFDGDIAVEGYTVISTLGYWNGNAVMYVTMGVFIVPLIWLLVTQRRKVRKVKQFNIVFAAERPYRPETTHYAYNFFAPYRKALGFLLNPLVARFWYWVLSIAEVTGSSVRKIYSGNVQTYSLWIAIYVSVFILLLQGGF